MTVEHFYVFPNSSNKVEMGIMCYSPSWMSVTGAFSLSLLYMGFMVLMVKSVELHNYYKFRDNYMFNASSGNELFRVRSVIECSQICSTKGSCAGFNFGLQKDGGRSNKLCALFFESDLQGDVYLHPSELSVYTAITHLNYFMNSQVLEHTTCATSSTLSKATPGITDSTSSSTKYSSPVTSNTITTTLSQQTIFTDHSVCMNPDSLLQMDDNYYILIVGQTTFLYNNCMELIVGAYQSKPLSILFPGSSYPVIAAYNDDTYIYLVYATSVYVYKKHNISLVKTETVQNHFKTTLNMSIIDMLWDANDTSVWIFTAKELYIIDQNGRTNVLHYDKNGLDNPYRSHNPSQRPDNIQAVSRDSKLRDVFVADNTVYFFDRGSGEGTWTLRGKIRC